MKRLLKTSNISLGNLATGLTVFIGLALMTPQMALAQGASTCAQRDKVVTALSNAYNESPVSIGLTEEGSVIEVMASTDGTFTIVVTHPNGLTCPLAAGKAWQAIQSIKGDGV
ncbi:MAG: hypothetical protein OQK24_12440 [Magnetovibrio sp.]|nr:hypothetical protein [Magnetovibrio sp.]